MTKQARHYTTVASGCPVCFLFPIVIVALVEILGSNRGLEAVYLLFAIFVADVLFTAFLIWLMRGWRWLAAVVSIPSLCLTAYLALFGAMRVNGYSD